MLVREVILWSDQRNDQLVSVVVENVQLVLREEDISTIGTEHVASDNDLNGFIVGNLFIHDKLDVQSRHLRRG
jgi:hypothetical protein